MTVIRHTSPLGELLSLRNTVDRLMDDSFARPWVARRGDRFARAGWRERPLPLDVRNTEDALVIEAALPGVRPEDVEINVLDDVLTIKASSDAQRSEQTEGYLVREIRRGTFSRSLTLPQGLHAEAATATFEHGVLRLSIPRAQESKPHQIQITTSPALDAATPVESANETDPQNGAAPAQQA